MMKLNSEYSMNRGEMTADEANTDTPCNNCGVKYSDFLELKLEIVSMDRAINEAAYIINSVVEDPSCYSEELENRIQVWTEAHKGAVAIQ